MSDRHNERDLKASIRELAAVLERGLEEHPTPAKLQDFLAGDLPEDQRELIEEHLALCRPCARAALDLTELPEQELIPRGKLLTESELAAQWQRFRTAVTPAVPARRRRKILAWAAVLLLTVLGFVAWKVRESQQPRADTYLADLYPGGPLRSAEKPTFVPSWARRVLLILNLETQETYPEYRVEILAKDDRRIWSRSGVPRQEESVVVEIPARLLQKGTFRVLLYGPQGDLVAEYEARFEPVSDR